MVREYFLLKKSIYLETGEMSKWLGEGTALAEDASAVFSTFIRRLTIAPGDPCPLLASMGTALIST